MCRRRNAVVLLLISGSVIGSGLTVAWGENGADQAAAGPGIVRTDLAGDPLPTGAVARIGSLRGRIGEGSSRIVFSPDGKFITATSEQIKIPLRLRDPNTGRVVRKPKELDPREFATRV